MRTWIAMVMIGGGSVASADVHVDPEAVRLTTEARERAKDHDCASNEWYAARVRALDDAYYRLAFAPDPAIAGCIGVTTRRSIEDGEPKSPEIGLAWSALPTLGGAAMIGFAVAAEHSQASSTVGFLGGLAMFVGPSLGHMYAGHSFTTGLAIRFGGLAVAAGGIALAVQHDNEGDWGGFGYLIAGFGIGGAVTLVGAVVDIVTAPGAVREHNDRLRFQLVPTAVPTTSGLAPGLGVAGRF